uniref:GON-4-like protein isoform X3 n=1 Tax=Geotrypetes seraphini TaxID=260995 RepID=A0A6P8PZB3_GEOSA|nr:GON-4-like protein isoform X3 [Geotrypetes seraphini]
MLPCKKRKLVEQPIPQSKVKRKEELKLDTAVPNLERSIIPQQVPTTQDENQESTGGLQTCENRESSDLKLYSQMTSKLTAESSLRSGKGFTRISALDASERNQHAEELEPSTWCLGVRNSGEGKPPKNLQLKGESPVKRKTHVFTSQTPKLSSQAKKSLQLEGNASGNLQESKSSDSSPPDDEERDDTALFIPVEEQASPVGEKKHKKKKATCKQKRERRCEEESSFSGDLKLDDMLNRTLEDGAKQHKLTAINVRNILHEVITNEHVVAMMKAAINETEDMPMFEPKMTRSKLKEVVEKGVVIPTWNISPIKKANEIKAPQFVDIPLEEEDSSDEEYQPEEEEEDETAEESLLESDVESTSSSPRGPKGYRATACELMETDEEAATSPETKVSAPPFRHVSAEVVPMGPPPPPPKLRQSKDSMFMEKLHAVDEELASSPVCMDSFQPLDDSLIAFRTRSKRPLKDIPLGQLEAELCAPDITPDMYDPSTTDDEDWKKWLQGLMTDDAGNEDEADDDDDDDPEYNFLEDLDEPDTEDFRNDRAVRITKKEVNELMEELFETFQDEMGFSHVDDDGQEDEDSSPESHSTFNTPQAIRFEEPLANLLNEQHRTVRQQLELLRLKKSVRQQQQQHQIPECEDSKSQNEKSTQILILDPGQKRRLQQQMQQHVQLLTQMHLLSSNNPGLSSEADTARMFLMELATFASNSMLLHRLSNPEFQTTFEPCNLRDSLQLIEDFHAQIPVDWSPHKAEKKNANDLPCLPRHVAWVMATCSLFMYPELLPICCLKAKNPRGKVFFTKAEDNLLALGLKHFEGSEFPKPLMSKYLLTSKTAHQLTVRIKNLNMKRTPENIIKYYKRTKLLPILFKCCDDIQPHEARPPVEREEQRLPFWLKANLTTIQEEMRQRQDAEEDSKTPDGEAEASSGEGVKATVKEDPETAKAGQSGKYPLIMPKGLVLILKPKASRFSRRAWRQKRSSILNPLLMKPTPALQSGLCSTNIHKNVAKPTAPEAPSNRAIQPATVMQALTNTQPLGISAVGNLSAISQPVTFQPKMMLPMLASTRVRKPYIRRGQKKKIATKMPPVLKPTPLTHPAPVIFTVPAGTVKLVSLGGGCSVIQSVNTATNGTTQGMPVTTVLVNTTSFSCPLTRPLVTSPLFVSSNPLTIPVVASQAVVESQSTNVKNLCPATGGEVSQFPIQPKTSGLDPDDSVPVEQYKEEHSLNVLDENRDKISKDDSDVVVKTEEEENQPCTGQGLLCSASEEPVELVRTNTSEGGLEKQDPAQKWLQKQGYLLHNDKEDLVLDLEKESDVVIPQEDLSKQEAEIKTENAKAKDPVEVPSSKERQKQGTDEAEGIKGHSESTKSMSVPTDVEIEVEIELDTDLGSPAGKPEDGPETGRDEEEEEDFDDLTQDEEDEEISSASEESVLSVPELQANLTTIQEEMRQRQDAEEDSKTPDGEAEASSGEGVKASVKEDPETAKAGQSGKYPLIMPKGLVLILKPKETMEKLTWLASERRLSQEGDSEEENSQEENSEPEEEEEEEAEGVENLQKDEMVDEVSEVLVKKSSSVCASPKAVPEVESNTPPQGDRSKGACKARGAYRARNKRGRTRASKDTSKLLLLYDENILQRDPLRDQKDLAFAQAYLTRVREALQDVPGRYEEFLRVIFEFETSSQPQTAVDLYSSLRGLLLEWPQLLKDFAAFLLPEQALECGLFEEQQAFDKSRRFLRQLEICFAENPSHHQKIIRVLQSCADCLPQEITQLKTQVWQLLKGHDHLQDEFSMFFDQLRPPANHMGDFEVINWTEEKEYEFDGFEEVSLPDMEEEEEPPKMHTSSKSKRRKETHEKELEWAEGVKECSCIRADGGTEQRVKKSKRRICSHCSSKGAKVKESHLLCWNVL